MITIPYIFENNIITLERELTKDEALTVTSRSINATDYVYYQGDEMPEPEPLTENLDLKDADVDSLTNDFIEKLKIRLGI